MDETRKHVFRDGVKPLWVSEVTKIVTRLTTIAEVERIAPPV